MRVFQVINNRVYWQTPYARIAQIPAGTFPPEVMAQMVETDNDFVREGWSYRDGNFEAPIPPDGWKYDADTGTFYRADELPPAQREPEYQIAKLRAQLTAAEQANAFLEECLVEMAGVVYGDA